MVINTMFLTVFVDPDLGFEIFLEKKKKKGRNLIRVR